MERYHQIIAHKEFKKKLEEMEECEKDRVFCCHGFEHCCDMARIMYILALEEQSELEQDILYATALLHDLGRVEQYRHGTPHHLAGKRIAEGILKDTGYCDEEILMVLEAIDKHRSEDGEEEGELAEYLYRADKLSRNCFVCKASNECYWPDDKRNTTVVV